MRCSLPGASISCLQQRDGGYTWWWWGEERRSDLGSPAVLEEGRSSLFTSPASSTPGPRLCGHHLCFSKFLPPSSLSNLMSVKAPKPCFKDAL